MNKRVQQLKKRLLVDTYPICIEKPTLIIESYRQTEVSMLLKTYFSAGGKHIQFNVIDKKTLAEAQENPSVHRDLIVRVAGYSAYFVQLTKAIQNDIVARTEIEQTA
jgi:pyruvate-formate lyase